MQGSEQRAHNAGNRTKDTECRDQNKGHRMQGSEQRAQNAGNRTKDTECRDQNKGHRMQGSEQRAQNAGIRTKGTECRDQNKGHRMQGSEQRAPNAGQRTGGREAAAAAAAECRHVDRCPGARDPVTLVTRWTLHISTINPNIHTLSLLCSSPFHPLIRHLYALFISIRRASCLSPD